MKKNKGFTLIELLAVISILSLIMVIIVPEITKVIKKSEKETMVSNISGIVRSANYEFKRLQMVGLSKYETVFTFENGVETSNVDGAKLDYDGDKIKNGVVKINKNGEVSLALYNNKWCAIKKYENNEAVIIKYKADGSCKLPEFVDKSGANAPKLVSGMTPIKWDGTNWVEPQNIDDPYKQDWYNYGEKKWANVKTKDGSYWVWIPRYAYSITSGYHTGTTGDIDIKFLENKTNIPKDDTTIDTIPAYDGDKQINYVKHPAFDFDGEISGFWIAKFEPSVANQNDPCYIDSNKTNCNDFTLTPKFIPNAVSWRNIELDISFVVSFSMKKNSVYGWKSEEVDTHLIKNTEWGAVIYLSHSKYGANEEVWINNSSTYTTGCAANSISELEYNGCQNNYDTGFGPNASTTHNIYGVYDMNGGAWERTAAYVDNGNTSLDCDSKYKNVYAMGTTNTSFNNFIANKDKFGDAVYEVTTYVDGYSRGWYSSVAYMPDGKSRGWNFFIRGSWYFRDGTNGIFSYIGDSYIEDGITFRPIVIPLKKV